MPEDSQINLPAEDSASGPLRTTNATLFWFCVRTQPKHEHIAAANVRKMVPGIDVFNPRFRIRRATRRGLVWFNEPLFPSYLFVRMDVDATLEKVIHVPSIKSVVRFGDRIPSIPDQVLEELRRGFDDEDIHLVGDDISSGDEVTIAGGPFRGVTAVVLKVLSAAQRVQVLMEMLGQSIPVEVPRDQLVRARR